MKKTFVLSISAVSGGGKTTITKNLCNQLDNTKALYFDEYDFIKQPDNIYEWVKNGSDPNEWNLSLLQEDVMKALEYDNLEYLILDYPFAKQDYPLKDFIDMTIYIDTPLDIALARRIIRDYKDEPNNAIINDLSFYLEKSRICFTDHNEKMKSCDLIIDGSLGVAEITSIIKNKIMQIPRQYDKKIIWTIH